MAKASSPIRLQQDLMQAAESTGKRFHRSTAEQIEYWADLGRSVSSALNPDVVLSIKSGLTRLNVEPVLSTPIDADLIFSELDVQRDNGELASHVTGSHVRYQSSLAHPGRLECIDRTGQITVGQFVNGRFVAECDTPS